MSPSRTIPETQRGWVSVRKGTPGQSLELRKDWPVRRALGSGQVLVKIHAAALNPLGYKLMGMLPGFLAKHPYIPELDFSGTVVDPNGSLEFDTGDEVFGWIQPGPQRATKQGTLAEYIAIPESSIAKRPSNLSEFEAAGVAVVAMAALQALELAKLEEGQTLFVNGGSTAVGAYAIQLAKLKGAKVVATASGKNEGYVRGLGADEFIDYTKVGPLHMYLRDNPPSVKYNVILEAVGWFDPSMYTHSARYLAANGVFVSVGPVPNGFNLTTTSQLFRFAGAKAFPPFLTGIKPRHKILTVEDNKEDLQLIARYLGEGRIKAKVDSTYAFDDVLNAYDRLMTGRAIGKVIVNISLPPTSTV